MPLAITFKGYKRTPRETGAVEENVMLDCETIMRIEHDVGATLRITQFDGTEFIADFSVDFATIK